LFIAGAPTPAVFRPPEEVLAIALAGDAPEPRILEAIPAVLAWNNWNLRLLHAYGATYDRRVVPRLAWLAAVVLAIHQGRGFPGGCPARRELARLERSVPRPQETDSLGRPAGQERLPPVSRQWNITYPASLATFRRRAEELHSCWATSGGLGPAERPGNNG
jgi:hypothetical protein